MTTRIFLKLLLTFLGLLAIAALGANYLVSRVTQSNLREDLTHDLEEKARVAELVMADSSAADRTRQVGEIARRVGGRATLIEQNGIVVADSEADPLRMENHATRPEFAAALAGSVGSDSRVSETVGVELLYVAIPLREGALRLAIPMVDVDARRAEFVSKINRVALLAVIPAILLAVWLARGVSGQVSEITAFSRELAKGNFQAEAPKLGGGELAELSWTLQSTGERLRSMFDEVQHERSRFAAAVNGIGEGILVVDRDHRTILSNPALEQMFPGEPLAVGAAIDNWSHPEMPALFDRVFREAEWRSVDLVVEAPVGRAWQVTCAPIAGQGGEVQAAVAVFHDITDLERVNRMRKDFVMNVSHELRTPLTAIQGYTETLLDGAVEDQENNRRFLRIIRRNAERLAQLTSDLMALSQIEVRAREFSMSPQRGVDLLSQAADAIRTVTDRKGVKVVIDPVVEDLQVECDPDAVQQALMNLLDNSTKYTSAAGVVTLGLADEGQDAEFYVRDTGIGISPEHIPRLFERFYRVDKARSRALGGTGLGLAIVKHLALAHGGSVRVDSKVGEGSTFFFRIPKRAPTEPVLIDDRQAALF